MAALVSTQLGEQDSPQPSPSRSAQELPFQNSSPTTRSAQALPFFHPFAIIASGLLLALLRAEQEVYDKVLDGGDGGEDDLEEAPARKGKGRALRTATRDDSDD